MPSPTASGWFLFIAALGMMAGLLSVDVSKLPSWQAAADPAFVGVVVAHFGAVTGAFVAGKLIPSDPLPGGKRSSDPPAKE